MEKLKKFLHSDALFWTLGVTQSILAIAFVVMTILYTNELADNTPDVPPENTYQVYVSEAPEDAPTPIPTVEPTPEVVVSEEPEEETGYQFEEWEIVMIAKLMQAEAGNQSTLGKRIVIDVVLNRLYHPNFPKTVHDVIYQKNQFSPAMNGNIDLQIPTEESIQLVREEIECLTDPEPVFFRASYYGKYGTPLYSIGNHYFSSYD